MVFPLPLEQNLQKFLRGNGYSLSRLLPPPQFLLKPLRPPPPHGGCSSQTSLLSTSWTHKCFGASGSLKSSPLAPSHPSVSASLSIFLSLSRPPYLTRPLEPSHLLLFTTLLHIPLWCTCLLPVSHF